MFTFIRDQFWLQKVIRAYLIHTCIRKLPGPDQLWQQKVIRGQRMLMDLSRVHVLAELHEKDVFSSCMHAVFRQDRYVMDCLSI